MSRNAEFRTPAEDETLRAVAAATAAGEDAFGDDEIDDAPVVAADEDTKTAAETVADPDAGGTPPADVAASEDTSLDTPAAEPIAPEVPDVTLVAAPSVETYKESRAALRAERDAIEAKWSAGELTDAEKATQSAVIDDKIDDLARSHMRAEAKAEARIEAQAEIEQSTLDALSKHGKTVGIDYSKRPMAVMFDAMMGEVAASEPFKGASFAAIANEAHRQVLAAMGKGAPAVAATAAQAKPRTAPAAPLTLRGLPAAATPNTGGDINDQLSRLKGQDFEEAFSKLSPAQKAALLND